MAVGSKNPSIPSVLALSQIASRDFEKSAALFHWSYLKGIVHSLPSLQANCCKNQHTTGHSHQSSALKEGGAWKSWNQHIHRNGPDLDSPFKKYKGLGYWTTRWTVHTYLILLCSKNTNCVESRNPIHIWRYGTRWPLSKHRSTWIHASSAVARGSPCGHSQSHVTKLGWSRLSQELQKDEPRWLQASQTPTTLEPKKFASKLRSWIENFHLPNAAPGGDGRWAHRMPRRSGHEDEHEHIWKQLKTHVWRFCRNVKHFLWLEGRESCLDKNPALTKASFPSTRASSSVSSEAEPEGTGATAMTTATTATRTTAPTTTTRTTTMTTMTTATGP